MCHICKRHSWRWHLDPRDPDYEDPPDVLPCEGELEELDFEHREPRDWYQRPCP